MKKMKKITILTIVLISIIAINLKSNSKKPSDFVSLMYKNKLAFASAESITVGRLCVGYPDSFCIYLDETDPSKDFQCPGKFI